MPVKGLQLSDVAQSRKLKNVLDLYQEQMEDLFKLPAEEILKADIEETDS